MGLCTDLLPLQAVLQRRYGNIKLSISKVVLRKMTFFSRNRSYKIQCAKARYSRKWSLSSRMILKSNPSWRFKYFHGKSESLDSHSHSKDLFYLIIFIATASGKVLYPVFHLSVPWKLMLPKEQGEAFSGRSAVPSALLLPVPQPMSCVWHKTMKAGKVSVSQVRPSQTCL